MRHSSPQLPLTAPWIAHPHAAELAAMSALLDEQPALSAHVQQDGDLPSVAKNLRRFFAEAAKHRLRTNGVSKETWPLQPPILLADGTRVGGRRPSRNETISSMPHRVVEWWRKRPRICRHVGTASRAHGEEDHTIDALRVLCGVTRSQQ